MPFRTKRSAATLIAILFCFGVGRAAALDPAYLSEMPDPQRVTMDFQGADRLDTLAMQIAALSRLNVVVNEMAGDRYYTPGKFPTPDEGRIIAAIRALSGALGAEAEATFDPQAPGADSPRLQWRSKMRTYQSSDEFNRRVMQLYFSQAFRDAHALKLAAKARSQAATRDEMARGQRALEGKPEPVVAKTHTAQILTGAVMLLVMLLGSSKLIRGPVISTNAPHRFRVGLKSYTLESATGVIANYSHREVVGRSDGRPDATGWAAMPMDREAYENFTLDSPRGSEPIQIATYLPNVDSHVFLNKAGERLTALWFVRGGERYFINFYGPRGKQPHKVTLFALDHLFRIPLWTVVPAMAVAYVIGDLTVASEYSGAVAALAAMPIWNGILKLLKSRSHSRFYRDQLDPLAVRIRNTEA